MPAMPCRYMLVSRAICGVAVNFPVLFCYLLKYIIVFREVSMLLLQQAKGNVVLSCGPFGLSLI